MEFDDPTKRNKRDWYDIEYEKVPHYSFPRDRLGHSDLFFPRTGARDKNGDLPFKSGL